MKTGTATCRSVVLLSTVMLLAASIPTRGAGWGATLKASTAGLGGDVTVGMTHKLNARAGINMFSHTIKPDDDDEEKDDVTAKLRLQTIPLLLDWHPFAGNFRASLGVVLNNNRLSLRAEAGNEIELNDVNYRVESFSMNFSFNRFSPYLGMGYGNAAKDGSRAVFAFDFGVLYHGEPQLRANAAASNPAQQAVLESTLHAELDDLREDLKPFKFYPVVSLGLAIRF